MDLQHNSSVGGVAQVRTIEVCGRAGEYTCHAASTAASVMTELSVVDAYGVGEERMSCSLLTTTTAAAGCSSSRRAYQQENSSRKPLPICLLIVAISPVDRGNLPLEQATRHSHHCLLFPWCVATVRSCHPHSSCRLHTVSMSLVRIVCGDLVIILGIN